MYVFTKDDVIVTSEAVYKIELYENINNEGGKKGYAYVKGDYFYPYYGESKNRTKPGVYLIDGEYEIVEPDDTNRDEYLVETHISTINPDKIVEILQTKDSFVVALPDSPKVFTPELTKEDDLLKRCIKKVLMEKGIDIDQYKHRFTDKNSLFNFKQVIKGPAKLSMLLFERGADALNLKYTITVEEIDTNNSIGKPLNGPISVSSDETFEL